MNRRTSITVFVIPNLPATSSSRRSYSVGAHLRCCTTTRRRLTFLPPCSLRVARRGCTVRCASAGSLRPSSPTTTHREMWASSSFMPPRDPNVCEARRVPRGTSCGAHATARSPPPKSERARRVLERRWLRRFETMDGQANHLAAWELAGDWKLGGAYLDRLLTADAGRLTDVAQRWLAPERAALGNAPPMPPAVVAGATGCSRARRRSPGGPQTAHSPSATNACSRIACVGVRTRGSAGARFPDVRRHSCARA